MSVLSNIDLWIIEGTLNSLEQLNLMEVVTKDEYADIMKRIERLYNIVITDYFRFVNEWWEIKYDNVR